MLFLVNELAFPLARGAVAGQEQITGGVTESMSVY